MFTKGSLFGAKPNPNQRKQFNCIKPNGAPDHIRVRSTAGQWEAVENIEKHPLVSCVMPTRGRSVFVGQALRYFLAQDYPNCELIVVYDEADDLPADIPRDSRIHLLKAPGRIGRKRSLGCAAAQGAIIAQWDDDDWYAPRRITAQTAPILAGEADMTALYNHLFLQLGPDGQLFWQCSRSLYRRMFRGGVAGGTLVYKKSLWKRFAADYPNASLREDAVFMEGALRRGARLYKIDGAELFIYLRHHTNSWRFKPGHFLKPGGWETVPRPDFFIDDAPFYSSLQLPPAESRPIPDIVFKRGLMRIKN